MTKMLLIDVQNNEVKPVECNGLDDYYRYIGCRCIDIVRRKFGGRWFEIVVDDEGLFVDRPIASAIDTMGNVMLVGNLLIAGGEVIDGELTDIADEDIEDFKQVYDIFHVLILDY